MTDRIEEIREKDDLVFEIIKENTPIVIKHLKKTKFPQTAQAIFTLDIGSNFIKNSIFDLCETTDLYGGKILFRSLIEHNLRFNFLFLSWGIDKTDKIGEEYMAFSNAKDEIDLARAYKAVDGIWNEKPNTEPWDDILKDLPNPIYKQYTKKEIEDKAQQYTYKNIIKKMNQLLKGDKPQHFDSKFLQSLIIEYSELSSFVHGGRRASLYLQEVQTKGTLEPELIKLCEMTYLMSTYIKTFSYLFYLQEERQLSNAYLELDKLLNV
jgi:hypothetical protein